jgi:hypothetical protein
MTPQDVAAFTALVAIIKEIGTWPLFTVVVVMQIGPWVGMMAITYIQGKRHAAAVRMYEDNVILVKSITEIAEGYRDTLLLASQSMTKVESSVAANLYCPLMRKNPKVEKEVHG